MILELKSSSPFVRALVSASMKVFKLFSYSVALVVSASSKSFVTYPPSIILLSTASFTD
nr:MAG TPA: hypothetical protein [Bacteriophage sp.]DAT69039.1 MAG TPA: hypothetical protein [Bacteriophage sp.]